MIKIALPNNIYHNLSHPSWVQDIILIFCEIKKNKITRKKTPWKLSVLYLLDHQILEKLRN